MDHARAFLDVTSSATGRLWRERLTPAQVRIAEDIAQSHQMPDLVARVLAARGVTAQTTQGFLQPALRDLMPDPAGVTDLAKAATRIVQAILKGERVAVFGDYDVDGAASCALLSRYFRAFGHSLSVHIPDRIFEGYGPNPAAMKALSADHDLLITVDCGTNSAQAFAAADTSCTIVVLDHHQVAGALPGVEAVVNPNREDDMSGLGHLCAAGVVFMTLVEANRQLRDNHGQRPPDLMKLLDLVGLATICDVVPLIGLNRAFVRRGLAVARAGTNCGLSALAATARLSEPLSSHHFGFILGPRINAGGRIGDATLGARLLATDDEDEARELAARLDTLNRERQAMEAGMLADAKAGAEREMATANPPSIIVSASEDWHPGIVGLIASRVKDTTRRPTIAIAIDQNGKGTGSGRSIPGLDLGRVIRKAVDAGLLVKGGGHAMAAGLTVEKPLIGKLRSFLEETVGETVNALVKTDEMKIDGALSVRGLTEALIDQLDEAGPYGTGHPQPVVVVAHCRIADIRTVGTGHLKLRIASSDGASADAIAFNAADTPLGQFLEQAGDTVLHLAGTLSANYWQGRKRAQLRVLDAAKRP